jgi:nucleotide-binding universal stress UspA family protein
MCHSILVPLDGSALSEQALPVALSVARRANAALQLAYVSVDSHSGYSDGRDARAHQPGRAYLEAWAEQLRGLGCRATSVALLDSRAADEDSVEVMPHDRLIARALHTHAVATGVDLVVMTTHSRGEVARMWLGSVADRLVRELSVPILLVRPRQPPPDMDQEQLFRHVLIPLDGSPQAEAVLEYAVALIALMGARCTLLQAIDPLLAGHTIPPYTVGLTKREAEQLQAEAGNYLTRIAAQLRTQSVSVQAHVVIAEPADAILAYAGEHAVDLIAMATHGRRGLSRMVMGSVASQVVHDAHTPVLLYRPSREL